MVELIFLSYFSLLIAVGVSRTVWTICTSILECLYYGGAKIEELSFIIFGELLEKEPNYPKLEFDSLIFGAKLCNFFSESFFWGKEMKFDKLLSDFFFYGGTIS